jgi:hypothetical protein
MKSLLKIVLVGAACMASTAYADVFQSSSGNGELTLFVRNDTTGAVYARGLQIRIDDVMTQSAIQGSTYSAPVTAATYSLPSIGPDAALSSFLGSVGTFSWTIMAGDNIGGVSVGGSRYLTTSQTDLSLTPATITGINLSSSWNNLEQMYITLNGILPDTAGSSTSANGQWRQAGAVPGEGAGEWFGTGLSNVNGVDSAANFYLFTGNGNGGLARVYQFSDITLSADGTLSAGGTTPPPVPLPAAVWLLGSGLVGLTAIGRRRKNESAAA